MKAIVKDCLAEGEKDLSFEVDKDHQEFVFLMCSKKFGQCLHRQLPRFHPPGPPPGADGNGTDAAGGPPPGGDQKVETFIVSKNLIIKKQTYQLIIPFQCNSNVRRRHSTFPRLVNEGKYWSTKFHSEIDPKASSHWYTHTQANKLCTSSRYYMLHFDIWWFPFQIQNTFV